MSSTIELMDDPTTHATTNPPPPPESPVRMADPPAERTRFRHPVALFAMAAGIATMIAIAIGTGAGFAAYSSSAASCSARDGWCDLGAIVFGLLAGGAIGLIAYIVAGVVVIRRNRPAGRRSAHIAAHIAVPPAVAVALNLLAEAVGALT